MTNGVNGTRQAGCVTKQRDIHVEKIVICYFTIRKHSLQKIGTLERRTVFKPLLPQNFVKMRRKRAERVLWVADTWVKLQHIEAKPLVILPPYVVRVKNAHHTSHANSQ